MNELTERSKSAPGPSSARLPTPPRTQNTNTSINWTHTALSRSQQTSTNRRSEGQRRRRERERREHEQQQTVGTHIVILCMDELTECLKSAPGPSSARLPTPPWTQNTNTNRRNLPIAQRPYREPAQRHDLGRIEHPCHHCGALHWILERSTAKGSTIANPLFEMCCGSGNIELPLMAPPPQQLRDLFTVAAPLAARFRQHIRQYNSALAFTSLGVQVDNSINRGGGPPTFRIHGELCHQLGSLSPRHGNNPVYAQLYIYDPQEALDHRMQRNSTLDPIIMETLQDLILTNHRWANIFKHAMEVFEENNCDDVSIQLTANRNHDRRRWNLPTADEVAVIIPGDGTQSYGRRDIVIHRRDRPLRRISDGSPIYECLQYPFLFIYGEDGYHYGLQMSPSEQKRLSQTDYTAYRIQHRPNEFSLLLRSGRLFQQYLVDMWAAADQNRLNYLRHHQSDIRASLYSGLTDAINNDMDLNDVGQRLILPSSYTGGPRYMKQCLQDSLALARYYRKIDLFITVTCNPSWPEITRELFPGQTAVDRPDLCAQVFKMKLKVIIEEIYKKGIFGKAVAYIYTIEFQKRGLPHAHILVFLESKDKILTPADIDTTIRAYWPDPEKEPMLFETVKRCMVHQCGDRSLENGKCTKHFPKGFQPHTSVDGHWGQGVKYPAGTLRRHGVHRHKVITMCPPIKNRPHFE